MWLKLNTGVYKSGLRLTHAKAYKATIFYCYLTSGLCVEPLSSFYKNYCSQQQRQQDKSQLLQSQWLFCWYYVCWSQSIVSVIQQLVLFIGSSEVKVKQSPRIPPGFENVLMRTTQIAVNFPSKKLTNLVSIILCLIHLFFFL